MMVRLIITFLLILTVVLPRSAAAYFEYYPLLRCAQDSNQFIIRFAWHEDNNPPDFEPTHSDVENAWVALKPATARACKLPSGEKIVISWNASQSFPYGYGGGNPNSYFSLKIGGKNIYYKKMFWAGYREQKMRVSAVSYIDGQLRECVGVVEDENNKESVGEQGGAKGNSPECIDTSFRLKGAGLSIDEQQELKKDAARAVLAKAITPACRRLRDQEEAALKEDDWQPASYKELGDSSSGRLSEMDIDINNDGAVDRVFRIGGAVGDDKSRDCITCGNRAFDGSYLYAFTGVKEHVDDFLDFIRMNDDKAPSGEPHIDALQTWSGVLISRGLADSSVRYVYNVPFVSDGKTYIYSFETNTDKIPAAVISKMRPDNTIETLCRFPRAA